MGDRWCLAVLELLASMLVTPRPCFAGVSGRTRGDGYGFFIYRLSLEVVHAFGISDTRIGLEIAVARLRDHEPGRPCLWQGGGAVVVQAAVI